MHSALDLGDSRAELVGDGVPSGVDEGLHGVQDTNLGAPFALVQNIFQRPEDDAGRFGRKELQDCLRGGSGGGANDLALVHIQFEEDRERLEEKRRTRRPQDRREGVEGDSGALALIARLFVGGELLKSSENVLIAERAMLMNVRANTFAEGITLTSGFQNQPCGLRGPGDRRQPLRLRTAGYLPAIA